ncbi:MAG: energy transducer TonB [Saprospiraceae bacterium]
MHKERKGKHFIKNPFYEGGLKAMREFISQNKKYPKEALEEKIEGTVVIKYTINYKGKVIDTKVLKSLGYGCDEEAQRVIKLMKFEAPKNRGIKVKFFKNIQIHFRLPKEKEKNTPPVQSQTNFSYTITPVKKKESPSEPKKGGGYSIQIKY